MSEQQPPPERPCDAIVSADVSIDPDTGKATGFCDKPGKPYHRYNPRRHRFPWVYLCPEHTDLAPKP